MCILMVIQSSAAPELDIFLLGLAAKVTVFAPGPFLQKTWLMNANTSQF